MQAFVSERTVIESVDTTPKMGSGGRPTKSTFRISAVVNYFSTNSTTRTRAVQIYQILVGYAHRRQTLTYQILAKLIGYKGAGVLDRQLGHLMYWCSQNQLPPLTVLVVNKLTGLPGDGLVKAVDLNADRERVFNHDWYGIVPPLPHEFPDYQVIGSNVN